MRGDRRPKLATREPEPEEAERKRHVMRMLGLLTEDNIAVRRRLTRVEQESARLAGLDVDREGRVR